MGGIEGVGGGLYLLSLGFIGLALGRGTKIYGVCGGCIFGDTGAFGRS